jgi:hypothetical protein
MDRVEDALEEVPSLAQHAKLLIAGGVVDAVGRALWQWDELAQDVVQGHLSPGSIVALHSVTATTSKALQTSACGYTCLLSTCHF